MVSINFSNPTQLALTLGALTACFGNIAYCAGIILSDDLYLGTWSPFSTYYELTTPVCAWTDTSSSRYQIQASNVEVSGNFSLENDTGNLLPFNVYWQDNINPLVWNELQPDAPSSLSYPFDTRDQCAGGTNTAMRIEVEKNDFDNAAAGIYTGTIVLTILPQ